MCGTITRLNPPELAPPPGYSNVVDVRGARLVFIAGQVATDRDGNVVGKGDLEAQAEQAFRNLGVALAAAGCTARDLVKLTVFVRDMSKLAAYRKARIVSSRQSARRRRRRSRWSRSRACSPTIF